MRLSNAIYPRIFVPFVLTLGIGSLVAWWLASSLFANSLQEQREKRLNEAIGVLARGNLPLTPDLLARLGRVLQADLYLLSGDGGVSGTSSASPELGFRQAIEQAWRHRPAYPYSSISRIGDQSFSILIQPLGQGARGRYAAIAAVAGLSELHTASGQMALRLGLGAIAGGLLLAWLVHRIAQGITTPINRLSRLAERVATGDLEARVEIHKPREIAQLADSLNRMAAQLQGYQQEIAEQNRLQALGEMAARIAHEIRNPLTAIKLQIQLLTESLKGAEADTANALLDEVRRLELIVSSTLQAGRENSLRPVPVDLNSLIDDLVQLFRPQFAHRAIRLETRLQEHLPRAMLDPDRIKQILVNLLVNAGDALEEGGRIRVGTEHRTGSGELAFSIDDSGPGIPAEQRADLFAGSESKKSSGLGIGLRLSRELAEQQGGRIEVVESTLGGARFVVSFHLERGQ